MSDVAMISLIATGMPDNGPGRRATSTGRYSNALSTGSAAFDRSTHAAAQRYAAAESVLNRRRSSRTPAPGLGAEGAVGSVMSESPGKTGLSFGRLCDWVSSPRKREMTGEPARNVAPQCVEFRRRHLARPRKIDAE